MNKDNEIPEGFKMTELGPLPEEWNVVRLGEVFEIKQGKQLSSKENKEGKISKPFLRTSNIFWNSINLTQISEMAFSTEEFEKLKLRKGDILVCEGGDIGRTAVWEGQIEECAYQNHLHRLRPINYSNRVVNTFFSLWMEHAIIQRKMYIYDANRTTIPNLSSSRLKRFTIPLPPLPEQKKIAAVLSAVQSAKEKTEQVIQVTKELKKSMMKHLFTYGPVSLEDAEKVKLKETEIGMVPEEWKVVRLGEVAEVKYGKANPKDIGNIPVIGSGGIYSTTAKPLINYSTIVIGRKGTAGKVWLSLEPCYPSDTTFYLDWKIQADVSFLFSFMSLNPLSGEHAKTTLPSLQKPDLENYKIPLPPLPEQQKIADILSSIDQKIQAEENKKKALEDLFKTLLHNLMTAKIRVNHLEVETCQN